MLRIMIIFLIYSVTNNIAQAFPKPQSTRIPMEPNFLKSDPENALKVLALEVYQDSVDENLYYYVPPFHIRQYKEGAANPFMSSLRIEHFEQAETLISGRDNYFIEFYKKILVDLNPGLQASYDRLAEVEEKLQLAIDNGNPEIIKLWQKAVDREAKFYESRLQEYEDINNIIKGVLPVPEEMQKRYNRRIIDILQGEGLDFRPAEDLSQHELFIEINRAKALLGQAEVGFLTVNTYAGFTWEQLEGLRQYKKDYAPDIRIALLTIDNLTLFGLNEAKEGDKTGIGNFQMFYNANGSGDYLGMTIYMDVTVAAGLELSKHLGPFILPVGINGDFDQYLNPTEAKLTCDFTNGFSIKSRADVKDGAVIFDNDFTNINKSEDKNEGACSLQVKSGDRASAEIYALEQMEKELEKLRMSRITLSKEEKDAYYKGVLEDIEKNRRPANSGNIGRTLFSFATLGLSELAITGLSYLADFHWHTNVQNIENLSRVKFTKEISIKGHKKINRKLATSLCLVYNPVSHAYDRCTEEEFDIADNMQKAGKKASASDICKGTKNSFECGIKRDEILDRTNRYHIVNDTNLTNNI